VSSTPYNHYSLLASIESELGLNRLGYATDALVFGSDVFKR
jgi:phosphatidylinositol-3-phosphatase